MDITRFNTDDESHGIWFGSLERGDIPLYVSDGNPDTVTIPDPLPSYLVNELDPEFIAQQGKTLVTYEVPAGGGTADAVAGDEEVSTSPLSDLTALPDLAPGVVVYTNEDFVRLRTEASTTGEVLLELTSGQRLSIVSGPVEADGYTWWQVETGLGTSGWVVVDFLSGPPAE